MFWGTAPCNALNSQDAFGNENTKRLDLKPHHPCHKKMSDHRLNVGARGCHGE